ERAIAISVRRIHARRAGCATFRIRLAENDRRVAPFGGGGHDFETALDIQEVMADAHLEMPIDYLRAAFRMKADKSERAAGFTRGIVFAARAVFEKGAQKISGTPACRTGRIRTTDPGVRISALDGVGRVVVKLEIFFLRAVPISNIGFVPDFPEPGLESGIAVSLAHMARPLIDQLRPFAVVVGRIRPTRKHGTVWEIVTIWLGMSRESFGHEADLDQRSNARVPEIIEDAIENCPAINRLAGNVFGIRVR